MALSSNGLVILSEAKDLCNLQTASRCEPVA
jgi:hypothetical protein